MTSIRRFRRYVFSLQLPVALVAVLHTVSCGDDTSNPPQPVDAGDAGRTWDSSSAEPTFVDPSDPGVDVSTVTGTAVTDGVSADTASEGPDLDASAAANTQTGESDSAATVTDAAGETIGLEPDASQQDQTRDRSDADVTATDLTDADVLATDLTDADVLATDLTDADITSGEDGGLCEAPTEPLVTAIAPPPDALADAGNTHDAASRGASDAAARDAESPDGTCFPSCITDLEALCLPSGACSWTSDYARACWENGLDMDQELVFVSDARRVVSHLRVGAQPCYQVIYESPLDGAPNTITWRNSCDQVVATAIQTESEATTYDVTCTDTNETTTISLASPACSKYVDGAPSTYGCDGFECPIAER